MEFRYQTKKGVLLLLLATAVFVTISLTESGAFWHLELHGLGWLMLLLYLLFVVITAQRYFLLRAVVVDERGVTVEKRVLPSLHYDWDELTVSVRRSDRRAPTGLVFERESEEEPQFLPLANLTDDERLCEALQKRLGSRYQEEGDAAHGPRDV